MCFLHGSEIAGRLVLPVGEGAVQPAGVDLRVSEVSVFMGPGGLAGGKRLPPSRPLLPVRGAWRLGPGAYKVRFVEEVRVPLDTVGLCFPRSTLLRSGVALHCAVWDPGYRGRGEALLMVYNRYGFELGVGERVAQLVFARLCGGPGEAYRGDYQGEGLGSEGAEP